jgi:hypothetical protein
MPKLSQKYLLLRSPCPYCGKSLRTRQGLAGHIRFRHPDGKKSVQDSDYSELSGLSSEWTKFGITMDRTTEEIKLRQEVLKLWPEVKVHANSIGLKLTNSDFKTYLLSSMAQVRVSMHLEKQLMSILEEMRQLLKDAQSK